MTDAQKVAAHYRGAAEAYDDCPAYAAELNAIADVVEAGEAAAELLRRGMSAAGERSPQEIAKSTYQTALAKLAKAVGVEGE